MIFFTVSCFFSQSENWQWKSYSPKISILEFKTRYDRPLIKNIGHFPKYWSFGEGSFEGNWGHSRSWDTFQLTLSLEIILMAKVTPRSLWVIKNQQRLNFPSTNLSLYIFEWRNSACWLWSLSFRYFIDNIIISNIINIRNIAVIIPPITTGVNVFDAFNKFSIRMNITVREKRMEPGGQSMKVMKTCLKRQQQAGLE